MSFAVRARLTGAATGIVMMDEHDLYLGAGGRWSSMSDALRFETRAAAEAAMQEKWQRLRNTGNRSVILSVLDLED